MIPTLLRDLLAKVEAVFFPSTGRTPTRDGMYDPLGDAELFTPNQRGSMNKDTNGKLYYKTKAGYQRTKSAVAYFSGVTALTTTNDTVVSSAPISISSTGATSTVGRRYFSAYQNSGGPLTLSFYCDAGKTQLLYQLAGIATATPTLLTGIAGLDFGTVYIAWSAAAGAVQYVTYQELYSVPVENN